MPSEKAILAGGCFWGVEELVRDLDGVLSTRVGYSGGDVKNATYMTHAAGPASKYDVGFRVVMEIK